MEIIEGNALSKLCDYSFGDHLYMAEPQTFSDSCYRFANAHNVEFIEKANQFIGNVMTVFIDNVRLYGRYVETSSPNDKRWIDWHQSVNDLIALCYSLPRTKFVILTSHEDTPIDESILIPVNVLGIHAVNALHFNDKIHPFPYGLQRRFGSADKRLEIMKEVIELDKYVEPKKLLYINCGIGRHTDRQDLTKFQTNEWITTRFDKNSKFFPHDKYRLFLKEVQNHKFMICPWGHGMDCHRNWESLYLRRVPIMKNHPYFHELMKGFPVLWVDDWNITKELLESNDFLYEQALKMDLKSLDLKTVFDTIMANYKV